SVDRQSRNVRAAPRGWRCLNKQLVLVFERDRDLLKAGRVDGESAHTGNDGIYAKRGRNIPSRQGAPVVVARKSARRVVVRPRENAMNDRLRVRRSTGPVGQPRREQIRLVRWSEIATGGLRRRVREIASDVDERRKEEVEPFEDRTGAAHRRDEAAEVLRHAVAHFGAAAFGETIGRR